MAGGGSAPTDVVGLPILEGRAPPGPVHLTQERRGRARTCPIPRAAADLVGDLAFRTPLTGSVGQGNELKRGNDMSAIETYRVTQILTNHNVLWEMLDGLLMVERVYAFSPSEWVDATNWSYSDLLSFLNY